jgi:hypothetical protein
MVVRLIVVAVILVAVIATFAETASRTTVNPFDFFSRMLFQRCPQREVRGYVAQAGEPTHRE